MSLKSPLYGSIIGLFTAFVLAGAFVPAMASAYAPYDTCGYGQYAPCYQGNLYVSVIVNAPANSFYARSANDFSVSVMGGNAYPATIQGSQIGKAVYVNGQYSVAVAPFKGFTPSYSSGCSGTIFPGQIATCVVTETPIYPSNYEPWGQYNYGPVVSVLPIYIPKLPNTGFAPQDGVMLAILAVLLAIASLSIPHVRKAFATLLG